MDIQLKYMFAFGLTLNQQKKCSFYCQSNGNPQKIKFDVLEYQKHFVFIIIFSHLSI